MAANKKANAIKEAITLTASMPDYAGYADYFLADGNEIPSAEFVQRKFNRYAEGVGR